MSLLHLLPDWMILSGLVIIGLILIKIFLDPCMAICHLLRDSSLTITEKISTAVIPATTVSRINRKGNLGIEEGNHAMTDADEAQKYEHSSKRYVLAIFLEKRQTPSIGFWQKRGQKKKKNASFVKCLVFAYFCVYSI